MLGFDFAYIQINMQLNLPFKTAYYTLFIN